MAADVAEPRLVEDVRVQEAITAARHACEALEADDKFREEIIGVLDAAVAACQPDVETATKRPALPDKWKYLTKLSATSPLRPQRSNVYEAMEALLSLVWPAMSSTERSRKLRKDTTKRKHELKLDAQRKRDAMNDGQDGSGTSRSAMSSQGPSSFRCCQTRRWRSARTKGGSRLRRTW